MGVILSDLAREDHDLSCNWWNWRPTLQVLAASGLLENDQLERMGHNGAGAQVTADEARRIAEYLSTEVLPKLRETDEVKLDGSVSDEQRWLGLISEAPSPSALYGASHEWLDKFARFCRECGGFKVY